MGNCCGPFKRGRPAKAVVPTQQCFVDCCGNLCPPEGCCESVTVDYECGCGCECSHKGFNFGGLKFKKKRLKIPRFSKRTLAANGFTFADGTVPTGSSSSSEESSSSSSSCVCSPFGVELTTDGCCLYLGPEGVEAVGSGVVTAKTLGSPPYGCETNIFLNGEKKEAVEVEDGELVAVEVRTTGDCECCEVQRNCVAPQTGLWVQKSNENGKTIVLDGAALRSKVKIAVNRVRKKKRN
jgi:hypothetical protein